MLINLIRFFLLPFSFLYGCIIEIRNWCYDAGIIKSIKFPVPIISIGNITAGGTGKTPFTIYLAELLKNHYKKIAIVSRGYGRKSTGMQLVSDGKNILLDPNRSGDEPFLIASRLPNVPVTVSEKRSIAIDFIIKNYHPDLILLDDAFQHRQILRDADIVLINSLESLQSKLMLPAGNLREFPHNLKRADIIVLTNTKSFNELSQNRFIKFSDSIFSSQSVINQLVDHDLNVVGAFDIIGEKHVFAFAGIAHPENFREALVGTGVSVIGFKSFPDHYNFNISDFENLVDQCKKNNCQILLCTEKDLVKISTITDMEKSLKDANILLFGARLKLEVERSELLIKNIQSILDNNT